MNTKKTIETLTLCIKNGWKNSIAKSINQDGSDCDLLNKEIYSKQFGKSTYSIVLDRFIYESNTISKKIPNNTKGWNIKITKENQQGINLNTKEIFYEPNSYMKALEYTLIQISNIEAKHIIENKPV